MYDAVGRSGDGVDRGNGKTVGCDMDDSSGMEGCEAIGPDAGEAVRDDLYRLLLCPRSQPGHARQHHQYKQPLDQQTMGFS